MRGRSKIADLLHFRLKTVLLSVQPKKPLHTVEECENHKEHDTYCTRQGFKVDFDTASAHTIQ